MHEPDRDEGNWTVGEAQAGTTLAAFLREALPGSSWSRAKDLCREGRARVDGEVATDPARRLAVGSRVELRRQGLPRGPLPPGAIVYHDRDLVVVDKPAGVLTVRAGEEERETLVSLVRTVLGRLEGKLGPPPRVVHRLDRETSGLLVFARSVPAERFLQKQLLGHTVLRRYLAIVHGQAADATHDTLLVPDRGDGLRGSWGVFRKARGEPPAAARRAVTHGKVEERLRGATLVSCRLETGRQHQIRIHLAEAGHPLVGEKVYVRDYRGPLIPAPRPLLHAAELGFVHPRTGEEARFEAPLPADFLSALRSLRG